MGKGGVLVLLLIFLASSVSAVIVNHNSVFDFDSLTDSQITKARNDLHVVYGHTSHGSQIMSGMKGVLAYYGSKYDFYRNEESGKLHINTGSQIMECSDLSECDTDSNNDGYADWYTSTKSYIRNNPETNVVMWSWCSINNHDADFYIKTMEQLIKEYPNIHFVYMTGHARGDGVLNEEGKAYYNNKVIREFAEQNNRHLYDFADIESYDPDGNYYWHLYLDDDLSYDGGNWGDEWVAANPNHEFTKLSREMEYCAHSKDINCALKGRAAWVLWASLAGAVIEPPTCIESWTCGSWSTCQNNQQTRTCTDRNSCGTTKNKPATTQSCVSQPTCTESWSCDPWSTCQNNQQTRACSDSNSCGTTENKPAVTKSCVSEPPVCIENWQCGSWSTCNNGIQTRLCHDANECDTSIATEPLVRTCQINTEDKNTSKIHLAKDMNSTINFENLSREEMQNMTNVSLSSEKGKIQFRKTINVSREINLTGRIYIGYNKIYIDSEDLPEFNVSATLELHGLQLVNPQILRNGNPCPASICKDKSFKNGTLKFEVTSFSEYSAIEGEYCGDEICQADETEFSCEQDCKEEKFEDAIPNNEDTNELSYSNQNPSSQYEAGSEKNEVSSDTKKTFGEKYKSLSKGRKRMIIIASILVMLIVAVLLRVRYEMKLYGK